jgi:GT2 family glycosyltransferase
VTGACLAVRRDLFLAAGGFDEQRFPVAFNDVDLCLRLGGRGLANVYVPEAELYHFEALSKSAFEYHAHPREVAAFLTRWPPGGGMAN